MVRPSETKLSVMQVYMFTEMSIVHAFAITVGSDMS